MSSKDESPDALLLYGEFVRMAVMPRVLEESSRVKFNPHHQPAGTSIGGQFAPAEGGAGGEPAKIEARLAKKLGMELDAQGKNKYKIVDQKAFEKAIEEYNKRPDAKGGQVLNTDIARELSADYLKDRSLSAAVHEPASEFVKQLYAYKLAEPLPAGKAPVVLFTAGGTGAGKSSGLELSSVSPMVSAAHIIYDTNMNTFGSADSKVAQALRAGHVVTIVYVSRDPVDALKGALSRAVRQEREHGTGRTVPLVEHAKTHEGALATVRQLEAKYDRSGRFRVLGVNNDLGAGKARVEPLQTFRLPQTSDLMRKLNAELEREHQQGLISDRIYRGFKGSSHPKALAEGIATVREMGGTGGQGDHRFHQRGRKEELPVVRLK